MYSWKNDRPRQLKKIAFALTRHTLARVIESHEDRGWSQASKVQRHGRGFGCLMVWGSKSPVERRVQA